MRRSHWSRLASACLSLVVPLTRCTVSPARSKQTGQRASHVTTGRIASAAALTLAAVSLVVPGSAGAAISGNYTTAVFTSNFDSGSLAAWTASGGNGAETVTPVAADRTGDGLRLSNTKGQYALEIKQLNAPLVNSSTTFWVRVDSVASGFSGKNLEGIAEGRNNASSADLWQLIYDSKQQGLWFMPCQGATEKPIFTGAGTMPLGSWNQIEVRYDATTTGGAELLINGATQPTWSVLGDFSRSDNVQRIQLWNDAANSTDFDNVVIASPGTSPAALPLPPVNTGAPVVSGSAVEGVTLMTSDGSWTGSPSSFGYAWEDCDGLGLVCSVIGGASSSSYTLGAGDVGHTIRSVVTASNAGGSLPASSSQTAVVTVPPAPANTALPVVSGTAQQGQVLSTANGSWSNSPSSYGYGWEDCGSGGGNCAAIGGATASSYTLVAADVGHTIRSVVTASNAGGSASASSAQTAVVSAPPSPPSNTALPVVSGTAQQGQALSTSKGTWTGSPTSYAYQWQDCNSSGASCSAISGATASSYTVGG